MLQERTIDLQVLCREEYVLRWNAAYAGCQLMVAKHCASCMLTMQYCTCC